jgi:hypothetical protein
VLSGTQLVLLGVAYTVLRQTLWSDARERAVTRAALIGAVLHHEDREAVSERIAHPPIGRRLAITRMNCCARLERWPPSASTAP